MKVIGEIGINHNASIDLAIKLIDIAVFSGFDYVKFQKRNPDICVPEKKKMEMRETPWGYMSYIDYKYKIEFGKSEYDFIDSYCKIKRIKWFASAWDIDSIQFLRNYGDTVKIPSALITDNDLLRYAKNNFTTRLISTGMSTEDEIDNAVKLSDPKVIFHTNSTYPAKIDELNLCYIKWLQEKHPDREIGYSGHEWGLGTTFAAAGMDIEWLERHITLDHEMWGTDHSSSVDPVGMIKLIRGIRNIEKAMAGYKKRIVEGAEILKREMLRK